jgi:tetratricopeptide (TPR) repeat protein
MGYKKNKYLCRLINFKINLLQIITKIIRKNMKKLILSLLLIASVTSVFAQSRNVSRARNLAQAETPNFAEARTLITAALEDPTTKDLANTWFVAGLVGYREMKHLTESPQALLNQASIDQNRVGQVVMESLNFFIVADRLDQLPDERGRVRPRHRRDIQRMVTEYYRYNLLQYGDLLVQRSDYAAALNVLNAFLAIPDLPLMDGTIPKDAAYYEVMFFTARVASGADQPQEAIRMFEQVRNIDIPMESETLLLAHQFLYAEYSDLNDTVKYVRILKDGMERFPSDTWFLQSVINHYIGLGELETALKYLETAISNEPNSAEYRRVEGALHEQLGNDERAEAAFKKALEIDPDLTSALEALGFFYLKRADVIADGLFRIRDFNERRAAEQRYDNELRLALPLYQRLVELETDPFRLRGYKIRLRQIYYNLKMDAEYDVINREIENGE